MLFNALKSLNSDLFLKVSIWLTIIFIVFADYERYEIKKIRENIKSHGYKYIYTPKLPITNCFYGKTGVEFVAFKDGDVIHGFACPNFVRIENERNSKS